MMSTTNRKSSLKAAFLAMAMLGATASTVVFAPAAMAQDENEGSKTLSTSVAKVVTAVYEELQAVAPDDDAGAKVASANGRAKLDKLLRDKPNMDPFDKATVLEIRAQLKVRAGDYPGALRDYESAIALNSLPQSRLRYMRFVMAQLYFSQERYPEAARLLEEYVRTTTEPVTAQTWYYLAASYYSMQQYTKAESPAKKAIAASDKPNRGYYDILNTIYNELRKEGPRGDLLVKMVNLWPGDKNLWSQLAGAYGQAGRDREAAVVLELAYKAGLIDDEDKILALAQRYALLENPYRGARLIEREMAAGKVKKTKKNYEQLGQMWNLAREQKKSIVAYEQVAKLSSDGKASYNLGRVYFADEQWVNSERSLGDARRKGGLSQKEIGDSWLLTGSARLSRAGDDKDIRASALEAFKKASQYRDSRKSANSWIQYINEIVRVEIAQDRVEAAQKEEARLAQVRSCTSIVQIADRGGIVDDPTRVNECRAFLEEQKKAKTATPVAPSEIAAPAVVEEEAAAVEDEASSDE